MNLLFPNETNLPDGFSYYPGFITHDEENELLHSIKKIELTNMKFQQYTAKRKTASFGYDWSFDKRVLTKGKGIPSDFDWFIEKVAAFTNINYTNIAELLITEYPVDSVINWHRDAPPFDTIIGVSLSADCTFKLRPYDKAKQNRKAIISLPVQRRSLYIMKDEARTDWEHSTGPVKAVRYSLTLRTLRG